MNGIVSEETTSSTRTLSVEERRIRGVIDLISEFALNKTTDAVPVIGVAERDDCAVLSMGTEWDLVIGTDFVRGTGFHLFRQGVLSYEDIGYYLVGANLSDIAAMGAIPKGILVVVRYRKNTTDEEFVRIMRGVARACSDYDTPLLGGDTGGYDECVLSATAIGVCRPGKAFLRSGGRDGDQLYVTGTVGRAGAALAFFLRGQDEGVTLGSTEKEVLAASWRRVEPAIEQSRVLAERGLCKCAIDTSDGLRASIRQVAEASQLDAIIDFNGLPIDELAVKVAEGLGVSPVELAISDSVDFRCVYAIDPANVAAAEALFRERDWPLFRIGELRRSADEPKVWMNQKGELFEAEGLEWDQNELPVVDRLRNGEAS